jgi:hypothetical protein
MVTVAQDLNLWFEVVGSCSGAASWSIAPLSSNPADVLGHFCMISPSGTVNEIGHFTQQGDSLTLSLRFATPKAAVANLANVLLAVVPGGATADPQNVVQVLQDLNAIKSVSDAGQELFSSGAHTPSQWAKAAGHALWDMKGLLSDDAQRTALAAVFAQIGVNATAEEIGSIVQVLSVYDLLKILSSEIVGICQTGCHDINSTFKAYNGGGVGASAMTSVLSAGRLRASSSSAQATVTWTTTPSATDWLINYSVTDQGSAPVWNFGVFYEPSVGAPLQVTAPAGWTYEVDSAVGTVTWYCQGPNGWTNGDFGSAVILPGNSLSGFTIRHTCPPDYSVSCSTDTGYTTAYNTVMTPAPALGIASAKLGTECIQEVINDGIVSAVLPNNVYYVEDSNRACGIRVSGGPTPNIGDKVRIAGTITAQSGEAQINATSCAVSGTGSVATLGIPNKLLGGGAFDTQRGVTGGFGLNNIGLLVRTWGKVTQIGTDHLYINDGSNLKDGTSTGSEQNIGIRVICDSTGYQSGQYIAVTGISSCFKTDSDALARRILTRSQQDIQVIGLQ